MRKAPFSPFYISENESTIDLICHMLLYDTWQRERGQVDE